jgi:hypothetical protein
VASTPDPRPDTRTTALAKARPSSSAVRAEPTTEARSRVPEQCGQTKLAAGRAHQRQAATREPPAPGDAETPSGPAQCTQRAGARHRSQDSPGA